MVYKSWLRLHQYIFYVVQLNGMTMKILDAYSEEAIFLPAGPCRLIFMKPGSELCHEGGIPQATTTFQRWRRANELCIIWPWFLWSFCFVPRVA